MKTTNFIQVSIELNKSFCCKSTQTQKVFVALIPSKNLFEKKKLVIFERLKKLKIYFLVLFWKELKMSNTDRTQNQRKYENPWILLNLSLNSQAVTVVGSQGSQRENESLFKDAIIIQGERIQYTCEILSDFIHCYTQVVCKLITGSPKELKY